jgi:hypothetical protein
MSLARLNGGLEQSVAKRRLLDLDGYEQHPQLSHAVLPPAREADAREIVGFCAAVLR